MESAHSWGLGNETWALMTHLEYCPLAEPRATTHPPRGFYSFLGSSFAGTTCWKELSIRWWPIPGKSSSETNSTSPLLEKRGEAPVVLCRHLNVVDQAPESWVIFLKKKQVVSKPLPHSDSNCGLLGGLSLGVAKLEISCSLKPKIIDRY